MIHSLHQTLAHPSLDRAAGLEIGTATSAFQAEGGLNGVGEPHTHWYDWERTERVERSGAASGLWMRYPELARRARDLGLASVRVSLEWARLAPSGESVSDRVAHAYASRLGCLLSAGIRPVVTLSHFTHPAWAGLDFWLDARSPEVFARYAVASVGAINRALVSHGHPPLGRMLTHNEPNMLALATYIAGVFPHAEGALAEGKVLGLPRAVRALDHLLAAHVRAHRALHALYAREGWAAPDISTNINLIDLYSVSKGLSDLLLAPSLGVRPRALGDFLRGCEARFMTDLFATESDSVRARAARAVQDIVGRVIAPDHFARTLSALYEGRHTHRAAMDHLAIDLYDPFTLHQVPGGETLFEAIAGWRFGDIATLAGQPPGLRLAEPWEWRCEPQGLVRVLRAMTFPTHTLPIDVDENGMALERPVGQAARPRADGVTRPEFLRGYLGALLEARVVHDVPVRAYLYWSVVDNYELGRWSPRFGLYGLGDPSADGAAAPWDHRDAAGDDAASVLGGVARAVALGRTDVAAMRVALGVALGATESRSDGEGVYHRGAAPLEPHR